VGIVTTLYQSKRLCAKFNGRERGDGFLFTGNCKGKWINELLCYLNGFNLRVLCSIEWRNGRLMNGKGYRRNRS
jgi:hypothetical protein